MKGWRTAAVAFGVAVLGAAQAFFNAVEMDNETQGYILMGIGVAMAALRALTTTAIGKSA